MKNNPRLSRAAMAVTIAGIFVVDLNTPLGIGVPFLYLLVALFAVGVGVSDRLLISMAALCTALAVVKLLIPPTGGVLAFGQSNRLIFTLLLWGAVGLELVRRRLEARVQAAERRFSALFRQVVVGIAEIDGEGRFVLVNPRYCELARRSADELQGLRIQDISHPDDFRRYRERWQRLHQRGETFTVEMRYVAPDGGDIWVGGSVSPLTGAAGDEHVVAVVEDIAERRKLEATRQRFSQELERLVEARTNALRAANAGLEKEIAERKRAERTSKAYAARLQGLANQLVDAQEIERKNLAQELHDRIGQNLSALSVGLNLARAQLPAETAAPARARLEDSLELVESTAEIVRGVMEELHPVLLDQYGLEVAVRWYGEAFARRTGLVLANTASELFPRLRSKVETTLFRIVQEALTNVAKHARAEHVGVALARTSTAIELKIVDDGLGMKPEIIRNQEIGRGWGLAIIGERTRSIGGSFRIDAPGGSGTRLVVEVPNGLWEVENADNGTDR